jgi:Glycosyl transferases group 1
MGDHFRGGLRDRWTYYWINRIEHSAPRAATGVTVVSNWLANEATRRGARKTVRLYNGMWPRVPMAKATARERFGLSSRSIYLGFMGRTVSSAEFSWCLDGLRAAARRNDVRLAICGPLDHLISSIPHDLREKVDYIGALSATDCFDFAAALDFALLPLEENLFNKSRFPIKLCDYLSVQTRVIASSVGECAGFADVRGLIQAGTGREHWILAVGNAVQQLIRNDVPSVNSNEVRRILSWEQMGATVLAAYVSE